MDIDQEEYIKLFKTIKKRIEHLEANDPDNENLDELKLILSDNLSNDGKIHNRSSLMNKKFHLFYLNYNHKNIIWLSRPLICIYLSFICVLPPPNKQAGKIEPTWQD